MKNMTVRLTTNQLADKAQSGYVVLINGNVKSSLQLRNMKGKTYLVAFEEKTLRTVNVQTL